MACTWLFWPLRRSRCRLFTDDGAPGPRPHYGPQYWGCFVRDLDGHKIEAMAWLPAA